jgi:hypothetical protein
MTAAAILWIDGDAAHGSLSRLDGHVDDTPSAATMARGRLLVLRGQSATLNVAWRKALHRPQPERDGGFSRFDGRTSRGSSNSKEDGAEKGVGRKISGALQSC